MATVPSDPLLAMGLTRSTAARGSADGSFAGLHNGLSNLLDVATVHLSAKGPRGSEETVSRKFLRATDGNPQYLPGQPRIPLSVAPGGNQNQDEVLDYLRESHLTKELDELLPFMKYIFVGSA
jgi:hypothetical protein